MGRVALGQGDLSQVNERHSPCNHAFSLVPRAAIEALATGFVRERCAAESGRVPAAIGADTGPNGDAGIARFRTENRKQSELLGSAHRRRSMETK